MEDPKYSPDGYMYTRGPGNYKIPGFSNIPIEFNVSLLKGEANPRAVYSSKVQYRSCSDSFVILRFWYNCVIIILKQILTICHPIACLMNECRSKE